jgi:hypothetical protein
MRGVAGVALVLLLGACASTPTRPTRDRTTWFSRPGPAAVRLRPQAGGAIDLRHPTGDSLLAVQLRDARDLRDTTAPPRATLRLAPAVLRRLARDLDSLAAGRPPDGSMPSMHGVHLEDGAGDLVLAIVRVRDSIGLEARRARRSRWR